MVHASCGLYTAMSTGGFWSPCPELGVFVAVQSVSKPGLRGVCGSATPALAPPPLPLLSALVV